VRAQEYGQNFRENIRNPVERLKRKRYRAKVVRRRAIPFGRHWPSGKTGFNFPGFEFSWGKNRGDCPLYRDAGSLSPIQY